MRDLKDPKLWASFLAWMVPVVIIVGVFFSRVRCWDIIETFTFVGALAGPFSALAGFLYIYATFKLQQKQIKAQAKQFHLDQTNQTFFRLFDSFTKVRDRLAFFGPKEFRKEMKISEENRKLALGEFSFFYYKGFLLFFAEHKLGWKSLTKDDFDKRGNNYEFLKYREGFTIKTAEKEEMIFLLQATIDEASFGSYLRSVTNLLEFCRSKKMPEFLTIIEANQGKDERVFLFYYLSLIAKPDLRGFLVENGYLQSVSKKHLLSPHHYNYLYEETEGSQTNDEE